MKILAWIRCNNPIAYMAEANTDGKSPIAQDRQSCTMRPIPTTHISTVGKSPTPAFTHNEANTDGKRPTPAFTHNEANTDDAYFNSWQKPYTGFHAQ
jgi:hypothetical protein